MVYNHWSALHTVDTIPTIRPYIQTMENDLHSGLITLIQDLDNIYTYNYRPLHCICGFSVTVCLLCSKLR